jgi:tetratricopeptide (TPR) repeat protein
MKAYVLCVLAGFMLVTPSLVAQNNGTAPPAIPEEARRHFVMGETMFKEAKNADAFSQAATEFAEAARLAPQWPDARYNLALAKEANDDYSGAISDLKLYQQFKLSDAEARTVQDKIYTIEAKERMKIANATAKQATDAANVQAKADSNKEAFIRSIQGSWGMGSSSFSITPLGNGNVNITYSSMPGRSFAVSEISVTESTLLFTVYFASNDNPEYLRHYSLSMNGSGRLLTGSTIESYTESGKAMIRRSGYVPASDRTMDCMFSRQ